MKVDVIFRKILLFSFSRIRCFSTSARIIPQDTNHTYLTNKYTDKSRTTKMDTIGNAEGQSESESKSVVKLPPLGAFVLTSAPVLLEKFGDNERVKSEQLWRADKRCDDTNVMKHSDINTSATSTINSSYAKYDSGVMMKSKTTGPPRTSKAKVLPANLLNKVTNMVKEQYASSNVLVNSAALTPSKKSGDTLPSSTDEISEVKILKDNISSTNGGDNKGVDSERNFDEQSLVLESDSKNLRSKVNDKNSHEDETKGSSKESTEHLSILTSELQVKAKQESETCSIKENKTSLSPNLQTSDKMKNLNTEKHDDKVRASEKTGLEKTHTSYSKSQQRLGKDGKQRTKEEVYNVADLFNGNFDKKYRKNRKRKNNRAKNREKACQESITEDDTTDEVEKKKKKKKKERKKRPTHFIAIQVDNSEVQRKATIVQDAIVSKQKELKSVMISPAKFHFTLMVMCLENKELLERAQSALDVYQRKYAELFKGKPFFLDIHGIDHFRNSVVFTSVRDEAQIEHLKTIASDVEHCFADHGILSTDEKRDFKPHLTLAKMSKDSTGKLWKKGIKKIDYELYSEHKDLYFGRQFVTHLQLCNMMLTEKKSGYYKIEHAVQIVDEDCYGDVPLSAQTSDIKSLSSDDDSTVRQLGKEIVEDSIKNAIKELQQLSQQESMKEAASGDSSTKCESVQVDTQYESVQANTESESVHSVQVETESEIVQTKTESENHHSEKEIERVKSDTEDKSVQTVIESESHSEK